MPQLLASLAVTRARLGVRTNLIALQLWNVASRIGNSRTQRGPFVATDVLESDTVAGNFTGLGRLLEPHTTILMAQIAPRPFIKVRPLIKTRPFETTPVSVSLKLGPLLRDARRVAVPAVGPQLTQVGATPKPLVRRIAFLSLDPASIQRAGVSGIARVIAQTGVAQLLVFNILTSTPHIKVATVPMRKTGFVPITVRLAKIAVQIGTNTVQHEPVLSQVCVVTAQFLAFLQHGSPVMLLCRGTQLVHIGPALHPVLHDVRSQRVNLADISRDVRVVARALGVVKSGPMTCTPTHLGGGRGFLGSHLRGSGGRVLLCRRFGHTQQTR